MSRDNRHLLTTRAGAPVFLNADTAWALPWSLNRDGVGDYLETRIGQGFNTVMMVAFPPMNENRPGLPNLGAEANIYGDLPFVLDGGAIDPTRPQVTPGGHSSDPGQYDYWDHLDYVMETASRRGMYVVFLPTWGLHVSGDTSGRNTSRVVFDPGSAYSYGNWLGSRYRSYGNIIWSMGGDRAAVLNGVDYRPVWRAMAEGIADGVNGISSFDRAADYSTTTMTYHTHQSQPNASVWFHDDKWLDLNSIQADPSDQVSATQRDWSLDPAKPTWLMEGNYEGHPRGYGDWSTRFQAYETVFSGGAGHAYGHEGLYGFPDNWRSLLNLEGARDMSHLQDLMTRVLTKAEYLGRVPDQGILANPNRGTASDFPGRSDRIVATRGSDRAFALVYTANGRDIEVRMDALQGETASAFWFNPRNGKWWTPQGEKDDATPFATGIKSGTGAPVFTFDPPGSPQGSNDWVLRITSG